MAARNSQRPLFPDNGKCGLFVYERRVRGKGFRLVAGVDEAGRGPLAGPVVASAVILPPDIDIPGINDSKKLSASTRERLFVEINRAAISVGTGTACIEEIDSLNILQATLLAMKRAIGGLLVNPDYLLIDGITPVPLNIPQETIKKGDSLSASIAAASIIAKVTRDRLMKEYHEKYPAYGFASHKGYGSRTHMEAISRLGPCPIHRKSFSGVKEHIR